MKRRILACLLTCCLLLPTPALAAENSTENFVRVNVYSGQFSDLAADSTFYANVSALYEYGLSVGKSDGTYGLKDSLTVGQAVIFAGRIRSLYRTGNPEAGPSAYLEEGQTTAERYLLYLQAEGVLDSALDDRLAAPATRGEMAHTLANVLPEEGLPSVHAAMVDRRFASGHAIKDVTASTPYYEDILDLYRKGICIGTDKTGSFLPSAPITRGAAAAMLTRLIDPSLRVTPDWPLNITDYPDVSGITLPSLVPIGTYIESPRTEDELIAVMQYMLSSGNNQLHLTYPEISAIQVRKLMDQTLVTAKRYCEQSYNMVSADYTLAGDVTLTFSATGIAPEDMPHYRKTALAAAKAVHDQLWSDGTITADMNQTEKARAYYTWICENCVYDDAATAESLSHIAYGLFEYGTAVCDGYTGAYNLLLRLENIPCIALSHKTHIWTVALLDDTEVHIDTTWGDSFEEISYDFFAMTPQQSWRYHPWE